MEYLKGKGMSIDKVVEVMTKEGVIFSFSGMISQSMVEFMIENAGKQLEAQKEDRSVVNSIFIIAIEQLQNIMSYSKERNIGEGNRYTSPGLLVVGYHKEVAKYYINSSNEIQEEDIKGVSEKIDFINSLDKQSQRRLLREKLRNGEDSHERGAGVGFIEMAKRSSDKLKYSFNKIDGKIYFNILAYV
jgi:hypothetical protein